MAPSRRSGPSNDENPDIAAIIAKQLQTILPQIVTQVTNNENNANANGENSGNGNGGNNRCSYKTFLACNPRDYDGKGGAVALTRWIEKMESVIENSGCAKNQKARGHEAAIGMSWVDFKALLMEEFRPSNKMEKLESEFWNHTMVGANHARYTDRFHELAKLVPHLPTMIQSAILNAGILMDEVVRCGTLTRTSEKRKEVEETKGGLCRFCYNCQKSGHIVRDYRALVKQVAPVSAVRMGDNQRACYECGSSEHCPKLNQAPGQAGNRLDLEGNRNTRNNRNQARGRDFSVNAVDVVQDPNVITGIVSLNDHFAIVLFDSGADFSFISTKFAPLLNVKPSIVSPRYVIEVANDKKEEVDRIIHDCKLELGNSLFTIDLIPMGHGSFDVIVGMDWLSKNKTEIVCHEKEVRIPLEGGETKEDHKVHLKLVLELLKKERLKEDESLYFMDCIWVPLVGGVRTIIMDEAHKTMYSVRPRVDKMYHDLQDMYWWPALYRRKCRLPVLWAEIGESRLIGSELVQEMMDKVVLIKEKLKAARDRQKSYADNRRKPLEFEVGDQVLQKVSPWKGVICFEKKGKLVPRYVGPFEILKEVFGD
ncbi:reverse transcriptase domain-containing protein [Tanacetum coccineum]